MMGLSLLRVPLDVQRAVEESNPVAASGGTLGFSRSCSMVG